MSITKGRHNIKMGVIPRVQPQNRARLGQLHGELRFRTQRQQPLSTGNGYANMLLGDFTTYTELTSRVDRDVRHWQNDFYVQDNWRSIRG